MKHFNYYRRRKITLFHKSNWAQLQVTMKEFNITYKELYKVINNSTMLNKALVDWVVHKKCTGWCKLFKPYNDEYFYKRSSWTFYSACKKCMWKLSRTYKIINSKDIYCKRKEYYKIYNFWSDNIGWGWLDTKY